MCSNRHSEILARYAGEHTIFRELLQNADDANAQSVRIKFQTEVGMEQVADPNRSLPDLKSTKVGQSSFNAVNSAMLT